MPHDVIVALATCRVTAYTSPYSIDKQQRTVIKDYELFVVRLTVLPLMILHEQCRPLSTCYRGIMIA